jgi:hypothetical protein
MIRFGKEFETECTKVFESDSKIGLLCSLSPEGYPHVSLITSISVKNPTTMMWGQFSQGLSKEYLKGNPKTGFFVVSPDMRWWTGKALHTETVVKGEDYEYFNNKPLFRYNSYLGFGAVHYGDVIDVSAGEKLPIPKVAVGFLKSSLMKKAAGSPSPAARIPPYGIGLADKLGGLKFIAWADHDGFPRIIPVLQGVAAGTGRMAFSTLPYGELLAQIPKDAKTAVFLANMELESLLLQGRWLGMESYGGQKGGVFETDKVYNSMLPLTGYVYPPRKLPNVYGVPEEQAG